MKPIYKFLSSFLDAFSERLGHPYTFAAMVLLIGVWFIVGIPMGYSDNWSNIMDICIYLATFFFVFIIQNSQNADTKAIQDKLDELIKSLPQADSDKAGEEEQLKKGVKK